MKKWIIGARLYFAFSVIIVIVMLFSGYTLLKMFEYDGDITNYKGIHDEIKTAKDLQKTRQKAPAFRHGMNAVKIVRF